MKIFICEMILYLEFTFKTFQKKKGFGKYMKDWQILIINKAG